MVTAVTVLLLPVSTKAVARKQRQVESTSRNTTVTIEVITNLAEEIKTVRVWRMIT